MRLIWIAAAVTLVGAASADAQQRPGAGRLLNDLNWLEVGRLVPDSVQTVFLPAGTVEPHGVVNNGADNTVPWELAVRLADRLNALVAPTIPYGVTTTLDAYPGSMRIAPETFEAYAEDVLRSLARTGFRNIVVVNGHGPNGDPLRSAAERVWREEDVRILVTEWWTMTADLVEEVWGTEGGHAGNNETGAVLAVRPDLVRADLYTGPEMATPRGEGWAAYPFPSSIIVYRAGEGYPDFDEARAQRFFAGIVDRLEAVITDVIQKWDRAGL